MERIVQRMLTPLARRVANMLARGVVSGVETDGQQQVLQVRLLAGEARDRIEHFEPFGLTAHPMPGAEHVAAFLDGDRSHGIVLVVNDRRYRLQGLPAGAVALYDAHGSSIVLNADGTATVHADLVNFTGALHAVGAITSDTSVADPAGTLAAVRNAHNGHTGHNYPGAVPTLRA